MKGLFLAAVVLAIGFMVAGPAWGLENSPASAFGARPRSVVRPVTPPVFQAGLPATAVLSSKLAPGQVAAPTFNEPGRRVLNAPWSTNTLLACDTGGGYSPPDGGITVNKSGGVFVTMNYFPGNGAHGAPAAWQTSRSTDRGVTWQAPTVISWDSCYGDPTPFAAGRDTTYIIEMWNTGSPSGFGITVTTNGGASWSYPKRCVYETSFDKELMCVDTVNTNYLYCEWVNFGASWGDIHFSRSTDRGTTWSTPVVINDGAGTGYRTGAAPWVGRGPYSGHVYAVWQDDRLGGDGRICMKKSTDHGATWTAGSEITIGNVHLVSSHTTINGWRRPMHPYPSGHPRPFPSVATDSQGRIFICYCSAPTAGSTRHYDPVVQVSTDEGTTWSVQRSANMAVVGDTADQYLPWLCVDPTDAVHVFWCDMRNYNNYNADVYYSYSTDHGVTFSTPEMVNDVTPCLYGSVAANYQGDYNEICADNGRVTVEWCDNRLRGGVNYQDVDASSRVFLTGPIHDVGITAITTPGPKVDPLTPIAPVVTVANNGTYRETSVPVHFRVDSSGTQVYNQLVTITTLDSGATVPVTFPNWTPGPGGVTYNLTAYHSYSPDTNRLNDTLKAVTQTRVHEISSASMSISTRVRALAAITPQLTLANPGDYTERSFNATCWIDSGAVRLYNQTVAVDSVLSGGGKTVSFPTWNTGPVGATYNVTMFNSFSDPNRNNDTLYVTTQASNQAKALIAFSDGAANAWALHDTLVARDSSHLFSVIDTFNVSTSGHVLPLSTLINNGYNVVVTWTNNTYSNATAMGDTLAAFMDQGGGVVVGVFADYSGFNIAGRYQTQYMPFPLTTNAYTAGTLGTVHLPTHPIMSGISAFSVGNYVTGATTMQHGVDVVDFNTGHILAGAFDTLGRRTAELGFFPPTFNYTTWGPQNAHLILNAMCWAAGLCSASGVEILPAFGYLPKIFALAPARPNPVRGTTEIRYQLPTPAPVKIRVYNVAGQMVRTLVDAKQDAGYKSVTWDGRNDRGSHVGPGVYLYRMEAGSFTATRKMVMVR